MIRTWLGLRVPTQTHRRTRLRRRPCVEALEDRLTPAVIAERPRAFACHASKRPRP
jgi:hypothetical protein